MQNPVRQLNKSHYNFQKYTKGIKSEKIRLIVKTPLTLSTVNENINYELI